MKSPSVSGLKKRAKIVGVRTLVNIAVMKTKVANFLDPHILSTALILYSVMAANSTSEELV